MGLIITFLLVITLHDSDVYCKHNNGTDGMTIAVYLQNNFMV